MNLGHWYIDNIFVYLFLLFFVLVVYLLSGSKTKRSIGNFVINHIFIIILVGFTIFGWNRWGTVADHAWMAEMKWAMFILLSGFLIYGYLNNWLAVFRNNTPPFVANGVFGSCALHYDVGMWTVWYLGTTGTLSVDADGIVIPWAFPNKIAITPKVSWDYNGDVPVSITQAFKTDLNSIPRILKRAIKRDGKTIFARGNIYFGIVSEKLRTDNPKWDKLQGEMEQVHAKYNDLEEHFDDVATNTEKYEGHVRRSKILQRDDGTNRRPASNANEQ